MPRIEPLNNELRAVMYHYVRPISKDLPYFQALSTDSFLQQVDYFKQFGPTIDSNQLVKFIADGRPAPGTVLTFDDGIKDHVTNVLPILKSRKMHGIFYIPTGPLMRNKILDVHRIHLLLGKHGGEKILAALTPKIEPAMLVDEGVEAFSKLTYARESLDDSTRMVKRIINYYLGYEYREPILDQLCAELLSPELLDPRNFYLTENEIKALHAAGMTIGSHSISHYVMSRVSPEVQRDEIQRSFEFLESIVGKLEIRTFCYPYGGYHSFTAQTVKLLEAQRCSFTFNVEQKPITTDFLISQPNSLPRFDCNQFQYGEVASYINDQRQ